MSSLQITSFRYHSNVPIHSSNCHSSTSVAAAFFHPCPLSYVRQKIPKNALKLRPGMYPVHRRTPVCLLGGEGKSKNDDKMASPWKVLENIIGKSKNEKSVEDLLRKQIEKQEYFDDGGNGGKGPDEGGGGGSGGGGDGFGDSDEEDMSGMFEELGQVILAVAGLIFMYAYILQGEEITTFAKDLIRFIFTRKKSLRLARLIDEWTDHFREKSEVVEENPYWLEHQIINTTTWWDSPEKYNRIYKRCGSTALSHLSRSESVSRNDSETRYESRYEPESRYGSRDEPEDEPETRYGYDSESD